MHTLSSKTVSQIANAKAGIGRAEAAEIARRYSRMLGRESVAVKWAGEWFISDRAIFAADPDRAPRISISAAVQDLLEMT